MTDQEQTRTTTPVEKADTIRAGRAVTVCSQLSKFEKAIRAIRIADSQYYRFVESFGNEEV